MDDVQSWPEVPSIAHFCSLFRAAFNLLDFDIEELEEALLTDGAEDAGSSLLQELIVRLLCGCIQNHEISTFNYQMFLRRLFRQKCQEYGRENPFNTDIDFQFLPLRVKVEILYALCDFRLDAVDVPDLLRNLESDSLRVEPLGHDENKSAYWYFYGTRLYREDFPRVKKKIKERKKRRKEDKRRRRQSTDSEPEVEQPGAGVWQVVCYTEADWEALAAKLKGSSCRAERELHRTLVEDFLPEIPRLFAEKERLQRRRMLDYQPRRQSTRLEKLKQKDIKDPVLGRDDEDKLRLERSERERRERFMMRAARRSSESGWEDSAGSEGDGEVEEDREGASRSGKEGRPAGRQTNNSLSSATGQIIIQPPKRKKLRSKQVFKTSPEDLRTGMYKILEYVKSQEDAWPFVSPVDEHYAPRYYSVIRRPMDLRRMEDKLDTGDYQDLNHFRDDFQLIVDNCRQYNGSENEYTEMAKNLLEAFNDAVDRYLESDPSSDEEVAVDFTAPRHKERKHKDHKEPKRSKSKRKRREREKEKSFDSGSGSDSDLLPPFLKPQRDRSSVSDKSGSVPGSDFDEQEPDFLRETSPSPPRLEKAESFSDSDSQPLGRPRRGRHRRIDVEDLNAATEETLKSITSMLEDMPLASGFSSNSNSPHHFFDDFPAEPRPILKPERPFRNPRDPVRRRKHHDLLRPAKRKDIRTIERLQPGKSKGNLIANLPKPKDLAEESGLSMGLGLGRAVKESRNALLVKTDDAGPKLSLGTVLTSDILDFGKNKHNFDTMATGEVIEGTDEDIEEKTELLVEEVRKSPVRNSQPVLPVPPTEEKEEEAIINKENDPVIEKPKEDVPVGIEEKKRDGVKEITNKATPNASAWFKAFGAPKAPAVVKKKPEAPEPAPVAEEKETAWGAASAVPVTCAPRRQRKASSSSSMSEPSSLSQDSPLHPVSPGLVSPRGEPPAPPVNGTLRVGFYQDMSTVHKCSPEKQSPHSTHSSPRELSNPSPFQGYSHVYPPSSPGTYANYTVPTPAPPPQPLQPPSSLYDNLTQYPSYPDQYRQPQPVRTLESYSYKPPDPAPKPNPSIFPVKKRLFANIDVTRPLDVLTETQPPPGEVGVNRSIYKDPVDRYPMDATYQQRSIGQYVANAQEDKVHQPIHQPESESLQSSRLSAPQPELSRLTMPPDLSRAVGQDEPPRFHPDMMNMPMVEGKPKYPGAERSLSAMIESLGRMPSPARGFSSPLERLMQPPLNTIQEDSDGVFRNKYTADSAYPPQRHQPPVSTSYSSPNLSHMVDRYEDDRLLSSPYYDKNLYLKNVATSSSLPIYQDPSANAQSSYELNIPKPRDPKPPKRKKVKGPEAGGTTAFQQYVGLKPTEPSVPPISLKTTSAVPGSAFNFGPGLNNSLYSEGYLDELRQPTYYGMVGGEKPAFLAPPARGSSYPLPQYMGHQSGLVEGYQQYLQRVQEEQLRHSLAYPAGYHPALGMRPAYDRPSWL